MDVNGRTWISQDESYGDCLRPYDSDILSLEIEDENSPEQLSEHVREAIGNGGFRNTCVVYLIGWWLLKGAVLEKTWEDSYLLSDYVVRDREMRDDLISAATLGPVVTRGTRYKSKVVNHIDSIEEVLSHWQQI